MRQISLVKLLAWFLLLTLGCLSLLSRNSGLAFVLIFAASLMIRFSTYGLVSPPPKEFHWVYIVPVLYLLVLGVVRMLNIDRSWESILQHPTAIASLWVLCLLLGFRAWQRWSMPNPRLKTDAEQVGTGRM